MGDVRDALDPGGGRRLLRYRWPLCLYPELGWAGSALRGNPVNTSLERASPLPGITAKASERQGERGSVTERGRDGERERGRVTEREREGEREREEDP